MSPPLIPAKSDSLSFKQALTALSVAIILGVSLSSIQLYFEFNDAKITFHKNIDQAIQAMKGPAAQAAYNFDDEAAGQIVEGLFEFGSIYKVRIKQNLGEVLSEKTRNTIRPSNLLTNAFLEKSVTVNFSLNREVKGKSKVVGEMLVIADMEGVILDLYKRSTRVFISTMVQSFFLALVLLYFFNAKITDPLLSIVDQLTKVTERRKQGHLVAPEGHENDEFGLLVSRTNALLERISKDSEKLTEFAEGTRAINEELEQEIHERKSAEHALQRAHDTLEERVTERTNALTDEISIRKETEIKLEDAKLVADKANRAKSAFLANMSHEIRTPLNAILGFSQILLRKKNLSESQAELIQIINNSGEHLLELINDVLDLSKIEAGAMELQCVNFNFNELLEGIGGVFSIRCKEKGLAWQYENKTKSNTVVYADQRKIRQILINLLGNAVKFTDHGSITLRLSSDGGHEYTLSVSDTGAGIPEESQKDIFKPFQQANEGYHKGGTGLGLSISKKMLALMGSDLELTSNPDTGSCFYFSLNLSAVHNSTPTSSVNAIRHSKLKAGSRICALVADDVKDNRVLVESVLTNIGVDVKLAVNGKEILDVIGKNSIDIVFTDIQMPVMDGILAVRMIRDRYGDNAPPCVAITAAAMVRNEGDVPLNDCFDRVIYKPFHLDEIFEALSALTKARFESESSEDVI
ncbi:hypothetical protein A9Q99_00330 [Gammaproteobacteria bacterium 45_16_T64]|nr:hypothetical protein A9Q99_00330 [Gammaproteobacteria bacterium 45_16_T64]